MDNSGYTPPSAERLGELMASVKHRLEERCEYALSRALLGDAESVLAIDRMMTLNLAENLHKAQLRSWEELKPFCDAMKIRFKETFLRNPSSGCLNNLAAKQPSPDE